MGKMKANRKFIEADERAVSAVIGVILMVAITVAIAATVYVYVSGMIGGTKQTTPNVACTVDSVNNNVNVATADASIKWSDCLISLDDVGAQWSIWHSGGTTNATLGVYPAATVFILAADYIHISHPTTPGTNVKVTVTYKPTNSVIGSWYVNV